MRIYLAAVVVFLGMVLGTARLYADDEDQAPAAAEPAPAEAAPTAEPDASPATAPAVPGADVDGDGMSDVDEQTMGNDVDVNAADADGDGTPDAQEDGDIDNDGVLDTQEADPPTDPFDADGDGKLEPDEIADRKEFAEVFDDIPNEPDEAALDARAEDAELAPSMTVDDFRKAVRIVKKIVLGKMAVKIAAKSDERLAKFSWMVFGLSLCGLLLLGMPLVLAKQYPVPRGRDSLPAPGQGKLLLKYSALAAATFFVTVNLFGGVLFGLRTVQGALSNYTNPSIAIAEGTFDTLDRNADDYVVTGKELFAPTLEQMRNHPDEQPAVLLLENGMKIVKDARVFMSMARLFKNVDFVFGVLPIILTFVTLLLFLLAIKPTLIEIVKLPASAAAGNASAGRDVVGKSVQRVKSELFATACTVGVLAVLTLVSSFVLGKIVGPALDALLGYFSAAVQYLQFVEGASSGLVFVTLFGVVLFLVLNLAALILSMSFFLGKSQKIFQARFTDGEPLANHHRFFRWGVPSVLLVQLFPLVFVFIAGALLGKINDSLLAGVTDAESVPWTKLLLAGPAFLVVAFVVLFWAARGFKAIKFLQGYKVKPKTRRPVASAPAQPLPPS